MTNFDQINMEIWVTPMANQMAKNLINRMQIRKGKALAPFLGFDYTYDNHTAVQQWTQKMLTVHQQSGITLDQLQCKLVAAVPNYMQGNLDW